LTEGKIRGVQTHVQGGAILGQLAPSKFRRVTFPEPKHPKHISNPSCYTLYDADVQFVCTRFNVHVGARDQVPQDVNRAWCIKRIAESFSESILGLMQTLCDIVISIKLGHIKYYELIGQGTFRAMVLVLSIQNCMLGAR
jgi:hypothetical protein